MPQPVLRRPLRVVHLLGNATAANAVAATDIDDLRFRVSDHGNVVELSLMECLGVLVWTYPTALQGTQRKVALQGVLIFLGPAIRSARGPAVHLEAACHDAVVTTGREHLGIGRGQRYLVLRLIERSRVFRSHG